MEIIPNKRRFVFYQCSTNHIVAAKYYYQEFVPVPGYVDYLLKIMSL